jgi:hypothetical protein
LSGWIDPADPPSSAGSILPDIRFSRKNYASTPRAILNITRKPDLGHLSWNIFDPSRHGEIMIVSEKRTEANRRNARLSTGPKTPEGKARSRANALKHGLCASVVVAEDADAVETRTREWYAALHPQNMYHMWMLDKAAVTSLRLDRSERMERRVRDKRSLRAELCWDDDRKLEAARLGANLRSNPDETVEMLKRTPQGCEWLMSRWAMLAHVADVKQGWTLDQKRLAFDLLATPEEFREGFEPGAALDFEGRVVAGTDDPAGVARREISALKERRDATETIDESLQALVVADLGDDDADLELKKLRRYEGTLQSRLRWYLKQIDTRPTYNQTNLILEPRTLPEATMPTDPLPLPEPAVEVISKALEPETWPRFPHPPFDLEPHEYPQPGQDADIPAIIAARAEKKRQKEASRRNNRRRNLEKLRSAS